MKNKFIFLILFAIILIGILSINVLAFMPPTHLWIHDQSIAEPINTDFYTACVKYPDLCYSGNQLVDIGVYFYYTQQTKYASMHSPSFCKLLLENAPKMAGHDIEKQKACSVGGCTHLSSDLPSHVENGMVQYAIKHSFLVNSVVHVFAEQHADNIVNTRDPNLKNEQFDFLNGAEECQDLFVTSMLGTDAYQDMGKAELDKIYESYVQEILSSRDTGYNPAFKEKNFLGTLSSVPSSIIAIYIAVMSIFFIILVLLVIKLIKRQGKIRHYIGLIIFLAIFIFFLYFLISMTRGTTFANFVSFIKPISNLVPIGNVDTYLDAAISNTKLLFQNGETFLEGLDPSGVGSNPVLNRASDEIMYVDYIILGILVVVFLWFVWFLFKRNKIVQTNGGLKIEI